MISVTLESTRKVGQREFAEWLGERAKARDPNAYELLNGRIVMNPPAGFPHGSIGSRIQVSLGSFVEERHLGRVFDASQGFELPSGDTVEPDHSFVSNDRWAAGPAPEEGAFLRLVPDFVVEVLSPSTATRDRNEKRSIYEQNGVTEYWLVDPQAKQIVAFRLVDGRYDAGSTYSLGERAASTALDGFEVEVARLVLP